MGIIVLNGGLQTTIQASPRIGFRHKGVPASGPADALSHALANRLVGNALNAPALEITLSGASFEFTANCHIAITGGAAEIVINSSQKAKHSQLFVRSGDILETAPLTKGARIYLAIEGGIASEDWLGSSSTYLPAGLGGYNGKAVRPKNELILNPNTELNLSGKKLRNTPISLRPHTGSSWLLRAVAGPEASMLSPRSQTGFFEQPFKLSSRASRMGAALTGQPLQLTSDGRMPSAAVFPGTVQCPPSGEPFLLMADAQTTGGYPRIAQIIRADRHMLGQIRPGDRVQFRRASPKEAAIILKEKTALFRPWLGDAFELR